MKTEILIDGLKNDNCSKTIIKNILTLDNVNDVTVLLSQNKIVVSHHSANDLPAIKHKLKHIGYPEKTDNATKENNIICNMKPHVHCCYENKEHLKDDINHTK